MLKQIQDAVEKKFSSLVNFASTAKLYFYIVQKHTKTFVKAKADLMDIYDELTFTKAKDADIKT